MYYALFKNSVEENVFFVWVFKSYAYVRIKWDLEALLSKIGDV